MSDRRDPTRSAGLRKHGRGLVNRKVYELNRQLRGTLDEQDVAGLRQRGVNVGNLILWIEANEQRMSRSEQAIEHVIDMTLTRPPEWLRALIERSVWLGVMQAGKELGNAPLYDPSEVAGAHALAAASEVKGIAGETGRRVMRQLFRAVESGQTPEWLMREIRTVLEKVTRLRLNLLVNTSVVRAVNAGKLFTYENNGVHQVGIRAEWIPHTHDSVVIDARSRKAKAKARKVRRAKRGGAASSIGNAVSEAILEAALGSNLANALGRIERLEEERLVHVLTAGDDQVCDDCSDIAASGPYDIDEARDLIPAHPNCRCAFIPFGDKRFAPIMEQEEEDEWEWE